MDIGQHNQITAEYFFFLVGEVNSGTCTRKVTRVKRANGSYKYETYHLIS